MLLLNPSEIHIPKTRLRKDFNPFKIAELAENIASIGILHLPILRGKTLVSGERRFRAMKVLIETNRTFSHGDVEVPKGKIPYTPFESLSDLDARRVELYENIIREDLPWQVVVASQAELHALNLAQNPTQTVEQTVQEIHPDKPVQPMYVKDITILAKHLHLPEVKAAKNIHEARKVLRKTLERDLTNAQRKLVAKKETKHVLIHGSFFKQNLPKNQFSVIIADPPWGIGADKFGVTARDNMVAHAYADDEAYAYDIHDRLANEAFLELTPEEAHLYLFCSMEKFPLWKDVFSAALWTVWPRPIIWYKHFGMLPKPDLGPRYVYETILFANKGNMATNGLFPDVIDVPAVTDRQYGAEKPVEVYRNLLERSATAGDFVLDPFCGSGPVFPAADMQGCMATGVDTNEDGIALAQERINKLGEEEE